MYTIHLERTLNKPIEAVFEGLTDHANYDRFPGIDEASLVRLGREEANGVGARRKFKFGWTTLEEDIVAFRAPHLMEYHIVKSFPWKVNHKLGRITLEDQGDKTKVIWISKFELPLPIVGRLFEKMAGQMFAKGFASILKAIERE